MATREQLDDTLRDSFVPLLRQKGFRGTFPHFRRQRKTRVDLLSFQHTQPSGGKFVIEIAKAPLAGITTSWGKHIAPGKLKTSDVGGDVFRNRLRLGSSPEENKNDHWFGFSTATQDELEILVRNLVELVDHQAEVWWSDGYEWWNDT